MTIIQPKMLKKSTTFNLFCPMAQQPPSGTGPPHYRGLMITLRHTKLITTPLDE